MFDINARLIQNWEKKRREMNAGHLVRNDTDLLPIQMNVLL